MARPKSGVRNQQHNQHVVVVPENAAPFRQYYWKETFMWRPTPGLIICVKRRVEPRPPVFRITVSIGAMLLLVLLAAAASPVIQQVFSAVTSNR